MKIFLLSFNNFFLQQVDQQHVVAAVDSDVNPFRTHPMPCIRRKTHHNHQQRRVHSGNVDLRQYAFHVGVDEHCEGGFSLSMDYSTLLNEESNDLDHVEKSELL